MRGDIGMFAWPNGKRAAVSLTFDDARPSQIDRGVPILNAYGARATFYLSPPNIAQRITQWEAAVAAGHEMGNHTLSHPCTGNFPWSRANALEDYTLARMEQELLEASAFICQALGVSPQTFAYPCGQKFIGRGQNTQSYVPLVAKHFLAGRGFKDEALHDPLAGDLAQVMGIDADDQPFERLKVWIDRATQAGGWLVFVAHDVGDFARQAMAADVLDAVCRYCAEPANGIWLDAVAAVAAHIRAAGQT